MSDELDAAIRAYLGARPSAARRQELALLLRAEAERQERIAAATERDTRRPAQQRIAGRRGGRPSSPWIRIVRRARTRALADEIMIRLSESLYTLAGRPARLDVQRIDGSLYLVPVGDAALLLRSRQETNYGHPGSEMDTALMRPVRCLMTGHQAAHHKERKSDQQ